MAQQVPLAARPPGGALSVALLLLGLGSIASLPPGCSPPPQATADTAATQPAADTKHKSDESPCIVVWRFPHYPGPSEDPPAGLEVAIWNDGAILIAADERCGAGTRLLVGRVDPNDVDAALARIRDAGFHQPWEERVVVDGGATDIFVADGTNATRHSRTEILDGAPSPQLSGWRRTRGAIESIAPIELKWLEEEVGKTGTFRGYNVADPWKTPWRP